MSMRANIQIFGVMAGLAGLCALPAVAQNAAPARSAALAKPSAAGGQPLAQALTSLATADGFEVRGLDRVGDETVQTPKSASPVQALRRLLNGYAYTLELAPAAAGGKDAGKLVRVSILGHAGDNIADASAPAAATPASPTTADAGSQPASDGAAGAIHPVNHMLQTLARSTIPRSLNSAAASAPDQLGLASGGVSSGSAAASGSTPASPDSSTGASGNTASSTTDMAALTRAASANLTALVQSLKAACPAGSTC